MTQNEHVYAINCPPEVYDDVIFGRNVKTIEGYIRLCDNVWPDVAGDSTSGVVFEALGADAPVRLGHSRLF